MEEKSAKEQIDDIIRKHGSWKSEILTRVRSIINSADDGIVEEVKWKMRTRPEGLPVWTQNGIICFAEIWKDNVKLLFPNGANLDDPHKLFNTRLASKDIRAIECKEGSNLDEKQLIALVAEAVKYNTSKIK